MKFGFICNRFSEADLNLKMPLLILETRLQIVLKLVFVLLQTCLRLRSLKRKIELVLDLDLNHISMAEISETGLKLMK